jgi:hypothetical protein
MAVRGILTIHCINISPQRNLSCPWVENFKETGLVIDKTVNKETLESP